MVDFGGKLREARERRGISLRDIAARTKISIAALEALEHNDISRLPGGIFSRAFVRSYAIEVGLNPDDVLQDFLERLQAEPPAAAGPSIRLSEADLAFERRRQTAARVFVLAVGFMILVSAAVVYFVLRGRPDLMDLTQPAQSGALIAPADPEAEAAPPPAAGTMPSTDARPAPSASVTSQPLRLELHPTAEVWVSIVADGKAVFARVMKPDEREVLEIADHAVLSIADAGAFAFTVNGRTGRPLGRDGQAVTVRITHETVDDYVR